TILRSCPITPEATSRIRQPSTSTRAGESTSKTSISFVYRQPADLPLHQLSLQRLRRRQPPPPQLHLQQPFQRVVRLQPRRGRRPHRERNPRQGFVLPRRRDRKAGESWSAFAKATADRQL